MAERDTGDLLALAVARLFYADQLTKREIASRLGISRFRVARLIDDALERGLVTIQFAEPAELDPELGERVAARLGLPVCLVARGGLAGVARVAADLLRELIQAGDVVGVAWGATVSATVEAFPRLPRKDVKVVQLAGGSRFGDAGSSADEVATRFAAKLGGSMHPLFAPAVVQSRELRVALAREPEVESTIRLWDHVTVALVGIGGFGPRSSAAFAAGLLSEQEVVQAANAGAVADLVLHALADDGSPVGTPLDERAVAITLDQLRNVPRVVAVAAGAQKVTAIAAVARSGIVSVLVTDRDAATCILEGDVLAGEATHQTSK